MKIPKPSAVAVAVTVACTGITGVALAQSTGKPQVVSAPAPSPSEAMDKLQQAAQRLREAVQQMARAPNDEQRNLAIQETNSALLTTQQAMIDLPINFKTSPKKDYGKAVARLSEASQKLRESAQAMARQPAGPGRNAAIKEVNKAILDTQTAMAAIYDTYL